MADCRLHHDERSSVGLIKQGTENPPLFLVHCLYGRIRFAYNLAGAMESRRTVYAIQPGIINGRVRLQRNLEDMAANYLMDIRLVQPHGPYWLGGYSFGGVVAFEMARQLLQCDEKVAGLLIFDSTAPKRISVNDHLAEDNSVRRATRETDRKPFLNRILESLQRQLDLWSDKVNLMLKIRRYELYVKLHVPISDARKLKYIKRVDRRFGRRYRTSQIEVESVLFRCAERQALGTGGWENFCLKGVKIIGVPGKHDTIFKQENIKYVAKPVDKILGL